MAEYQVLMTAAGRDSDTFKAASLGLMKSEIAVGEKTILEHAIGSYFTNISKDIVVLLKGEFSLRTLERLEYLAKDIEILVLKNSTSGALCSALMAIDLLDLDLPLFIAPADSYVAENISALYNRFLKSDAIAGTVLFESTETRWSYARTLKDFQIVEMSEKDAISNFASTGTFFFRTARDFVDAAQWVLVENFNTNGEFYISSTINHLIMNGYRVQGEPLAANISYHPLSSPADCLKEMQ
jgi:NDP-sugar pyrophosphorylase family protein